MTDVNKNKVKVLGAWRNISAQYVKVDGAWVAVTGVYTKVNGEWRTSYPYPLSADATVQAITYAGQQIANGGTASYPNTSGATVQVRVVPTSAAATVSGGSNPWTSASGVWETTKSVSYAANPNSFSFTITAENGLYTATYTVYLNVAAPAAVVIYWTYCNGYTSYRDSGSVSGTTDPTTACNQKYSQLGNPAYWNCNGSGVPPASCPVQPCCTYDYEVCTVNGNGTVTYTWYYTDPCGAICTRPNGSLIPCCPPTTYTYSGTMCAL